MPLMRPLLNSTGHGPMLRPARRAAAGDHARQGRLLWWGSFVATGGRGPAPTDTPTRFHQTVAAGLLLAQQMPHER